MAKVWDKSQAGVSTIGKLGYGRWFLMGSVSGATADATYQGSELLFGYRDSYSPTQTLISGTLGGLGGVLGRKVSSMYDKFVKSKAHRESA
jgi:hypothetical protein